MNKSTHFDMGIDERQQPRTFRVDAGDERTSTAVVDLVATVLDEDPVDLPPLHRAVDTDALNAFGRGRRGEAVRARLQFRYEGCDLTVFDDGEIVLEPSPALAKRAGGTFEQ